MPIFDLKCQKCGHEVKDELVPQDADTIACPICNEQMTKLPSTFGFNMVPGELSKFKRKMGNKLPDNYKDQAKGGCNVYRPKQ